MSRHRQLVGQAPSRQWESTGYKRPSSHTAAAAGEWQFKVMSYNILSPTHLNENMHLYGHCDPACLEWDVRKQRLVAEIVSSHCDVVCLQEVDEADYVNYFEPELYDAGYIGRYIKKPGDHPDGCATFFLSGKFSVEQESELCYFVGERTVLDRFNVALVLRLKPKGCPVGTPSVCVANTHLLFNPKRGDVKLSQTAMLLAELDRLASVTGRSRVGTNNADALADRFAALRLSAGYCPTIVCGDFNMLPFCPIYKLLLCKELAYEGLDSVTLSGQEKVRNDLEVRPLRRDLLPLASRVTNACRRMTNSNTGNGREMQGILTHQFEFVSAYRHHTFRNSNASHRDMHRSRDVKVKEITSQHQRAACTLDYIFYTVDTKFVEETPSGSLYISEVREGALRLIGRFGLLSEEEVVLAGGLPNATMPSDHLPLVAQFALTAR